MNEIVIVGDVHEGINFDIKVDPQTGVSERALDMHHNLVRAANYAAEHKASIFIVLGDLFDRTHVAPIFREYVRNDVIEPLAKAGVKIFILAGNHDQPREFRRGTSIDDFRGYPNVSIFRKPECRVENIDNKQISFIIMPFLHPDTLIGQAGREVSGIPEAQRLETGRQIMRELLQEYSKQMADSRILLAHYYFEGTDLSSTIAPEIEPGEIEFNASMIPEDVDLGVFGHVHLSQTKVVRNIPLIFVGAVERIDWGEREGKKVFLTIDPIDLKWTFHDLPTREMIQIRVEIKADDANPTQSIIDRIPADVKDKMVRIEVYIPEGTRRLIQENRLADLLKSCFEYKFKWHPIMTKSIGGPPETGLTPQLLLESFIELNYAKHRQRAELLARGQDILKEALEE